MTTSRRDRHSGAAATTTIAYATNPDDGIRIYYETTGDGPPLLLHHPTATSSALWRELGYVDALAPEFRLILPDARGHGHSDHPTNDDAYQTRLLVGDILAILDHANIKRTHYLGYSLGGRIAYPLALAAADRLTSIAIGGASHRPQQGIHDPVDYAAITSALTRNDTDTSREAEPRRDSTLPHTRLRAFPTDPRALPAYLRQTQREPGMPPHSLRALTMPILLFAGQHDHQHLRDAHTAVAELQNGRLLTIPNDDHLSTLTATEKTLPPLTTFFRLTADRPAGQLARAHRKTTQPRETGDLNRRKPP